MSEPIRRLALQLHAALLQAPPSQWSAEQPEPQVAQPETAVNVPMSRTIRDRARI